MQKVWYDLKNDEKESIKMKKIFLLLITFLFIGCASVKISSFKNPDVDISKYKKIIVYGNTKDIEYRKTLEADITAAFKEKSIDAVSSIDIISPVKEYTQEEIKKIYIDNKIDSILTVAIIDVKTETVYVPPTNYTNYNTQIVNGVVVSTPYTTTTGGYSSSYSKITFEIILKDLKTGETAFKATANSEGSGLSNFDGISMSLAREIVLEYISLSTSEAPKEPETNQPEKEENTIH